MIVDPDFLDHWRTRMLIDALGGDELAPIYVMRIWAHCQSRKATRFDMPAKGLKALCRYAGDEALLEAAMIDAGFVTRSSVAIEVSGWADHNAKLIANWRNGVTGGRPSRTEEEPIDNPNETQIEPTVTQAEPIREDKRRTKTNASANADFEMFWAAYPKRRNRGDAEKAWAKLKLNDDLLKTILIAVEVSKTRDDWRKNDGQFVPYPASWLNAKGWLDDSRKTLVPEMSWE